jgi:hypothetical protein
MVRLACLVLGDLILNTGLIGNETKSGPTFGNQRGQREMFVITPVVSNCGVANVLVGDQVRESLRKWVPSPDPSTNHSIACGIQHDGSAQWFFRGANVFGMEIHWLSLVDLWQAYVLPSPSLAQR